MSEKNASKRRAKGWQNNPALAGRDLFILVSASDLFKAARFFHKVTQRSAALVQLVRRFT
jgi:hypothetical protein